MILNLPKTNKLFTNAILVTYICKNCIDVVVTAFIWRHQEWSEFVGRHDVRAPVFQQVVGIGTHCAVLSLGGRRYKAQYLK